MSKEVACSRCAVLTDLPAEVYLGLGTIKTVCPTCLGISWDDWSKFIQQGWGKNQIKDGLNEQATSKDAQHSASAAGRPYQ